MTAKRILWGLVALIVVAWIFYIGSTRYDAGRGTGDVYSNDPPSGKNKTADSDTRPSQPIVYPAPGQTVATMPTAPTGEVQTMTGQAGQIGQPGSAAIAATGSIPASDSISPSRPMEWSSPVPASFSFTARATSPGGLIPTLAAPASSSQLTKSGRSRASSRLVAAGPSNPIRCSYQVFSHTSNTG